MCTCRRAPCIKGVSSSRVHHRSGMTKRRHAAAVRTWSRQERGTASNAARWIASKNDNTRVVETTTLQPAIRRALSAGIEGFILREIDHCLLLTKCVGAFRSQLKSLEPRNRPRKGHGSRARHDHAGAEHRTDAFVSRRSRENALARAAVSAPLVKRRRQR